MEWERGMPVLIGMKHAYNRGYIEVAGKLCYYYDLIAPASHRVVYKPAYGKKQMWIIATGDLLPIMTNEEGVIFLKEEELL